MLQHHRLPVGSPCDWGDVAERGNRMSDPFSDRYWIEEFQITEKDLARIGDHIRETNQAYDLTVLARRVARGRLRYGPEEGSVPAQREWIEDPLVRLWDPAADWEQGDQTYVWTWSFVRKRSEVIVGEVTEMDEQFVYITVDDEYQPVRQFQRAEPHSSEAVKWHQKVVQAIEGLKKGATEAEQIEHVVLKHGEQMMSQLLDAMNDYQGFIRLSGRWFLRELAVPPTDQQLAALAWAMLLLEEPKSTADLASLVEPPFAGGDPGLFGLYLAMRESAVFENADPGQRPRWVLAGPPPGTCTPHYAAYDPETYEVLCIPGHETSPEAVQRLWETDLLRAVVGAS